MSSMKENPLEMLPWHSARNIVCSARSVDFYSSSLLTVFWEISLFRLSIVTVISPIFFSPICQIELQKIVFSNRSLDCSKLVNLLSGSVGQSKVSELVLERSSNIKPQQEEI